MNNFLKHLIEDPKVYYVYQRGSSIYELNAKDSDTDYLVIIDSEYQLPEEFAECQVVTEYNNPRKNIKFDNCDFIFMYVQTWFDKALDNDIQAWECACLNKKFIKKEHVKLILKTEPIKLIKNLIKQIPKLSNLADNPKELWYFVKDVLFTQQILDYHKIVNFKEANQYRKLIEDADTQDRLNFAIDVWKQFYEKNKSQYEYYIKSIKQN